MIAIAIELDAGSEKTISLTAELQKKISLAKEWKYEGCIFSLHQQ